MTDYISRADAIDAVAEEWLSEASAESPYVNDYDIDKYRELAEELFADIPSADAVQGEWIYDHHNDEHTCSVCGRKALCDDYVGIDWQMEVLSDYCPSCGARMKGGVK